MMRNQLLSRQLDFGARFVIYEEIDILQPFLLETLLKQEEDQDQDEIMLLRKPVVLFIFWPMVMRT